MKHALLLICCLQLHARDFQRHMIAASVTGYFRPVARAIGSGNRVGVGAAYGFRALRNVQLDLALDLIPGPVGGDFCCRFADTAGDWLYLVPAGGRFILPPGSPRWLLSVGGGVLAAHYRRGEQVVLGFLASETEWGGYGLASGSYSLTNDGHWRAGTTVRYDAAGFHRDVVLRGEFGYSF